MEMGYKSVSKKWFPLASVGKISLKTDTVF